MVEIDERDDHGGPVGAATSEPTAERERVAERLLASEEKYRTLFDSIDEGFCVIEVLFDELDAPVDYRFLEVNRVFEKQTGIPNAVGRRMRELAPAHEDHWFRIYGQVAVTGEPLRFENPAVALGRHYDVYAFRVGKPEHRQVAVLFSDITERRRTEAERGRLIQELRAAQDQLRADLDATNRLLQVGTLFLQEGNLEQILGELLEAAIAISHADFGNIQILDPRSAELTIAAHRGFPSWWLEFWATHASGQGVCGTALERGARVIVDDVETSPIFAGKPALEIQRKAGVRAVQSTPLIGRSGKPIGMISTHYKRAGRPSEHALRLLDLLARQAADILERAQVEDALRAANARLLEADARKDNFLAMLSHELRNPLAPIRNSLSIFHQVAPGSEQARRAQAVLDRQVEHLTRMVDDLLDVSRITRDKVQLQREPIDLNDLAQRTVEDHFLEFVEAGVLLEVAPAPVEVWVSGDRTRLAQAIGNLLHNAAKFTPQGGTTTLMVEEDAVRGRALVHVRDTGKGIEPGLLPHVFEAFTQADTTADRSTGGLGLGLSVVEGLVEMHGGSVSAVSDGPGKGATFTIALPVDARTPATLDIRSPAPPKPPMPRVTGASRRVLIIEDNIDAAMSLGELLEIEGHDVAVAHDGREGIAKARSFHPDLVICDIGLPEMDGFEVAREIRAHPEIGRVALVALTGYTQPEDVANASAAGFDAHLAKPASFEALRRVVGSVVHRG